MTKTTQNQLAKRSAEKAKRPLIVPLGPSPMRFLQDQTCLTTDQVLENAQRQIHDYSVGLVYKDQLSGSGTLVKWDEQLGILTAGHVIAQLDLTSTNKLHIPLLASGHSYQIPCCALKTVALFNESGGPDLALVGLPPESLLGSLARKKSFFNLTLHKRRKLSESLGNTGLFLISGGPAALSSPVEPNHGFKKVVNSPSVRFQGLLEKRFVKDSFDYVELEIGCRSQLGVEDLRGVSGGGLWRVMVANSKQKERYDYRGAALAGVVFYQKDMKPNGTRNVLCQGGKSIFVRLAKAAKENGRGQISTSDKLD